MPLSAQDLKIDQTTIPLSGPWPSLLLITNINVPYRLFDQLEDILGRIARFLDQEYLEEPFRFQLTASLVLHHRATGEQRFWSGSFAPNANYPNTVLPFQTFEADRFVEDTLPLLQGDFIADLNRPNIATDWVLRNIVSVIVSCQGRVRLGHATVVRRGLSTPRNGRHQRRHLTYSLP